MSNNIFNEFFEERKYEINPMTKKDLKVEINCGLERFDNKEYIDTLWERLNNKKENYKVYVIRENDTCVGLFSFDFRNPFYFWQSRSTGSN